MITPELLSRYPFFSDLELDDITVLAKSADGITSGTGNFIFHKGDELKYFYIIVEGAIGIVQEESGKDKQSDTVISAIGPGHVFAWSSLVPPFIATASAKVLAPCWLIAFDCEFLLKAFEEDCRFGYRLMQKIVQISRDRLLDARIESLLFMA